MINNNAYTSKSYRFIVKFMILSFVISISANLMLIIDNQNLEGALQKMVENERGKLEKLENYAENGIFVEYNVCKMLLSDAPFFHSEGEFLDFFAGIKHKMVIQTPPDNLLKLYNRRAQSERANKHN